MDVGTKFVYTCDPDMRKYFINMGMKLLKKVELGNTDFYVFIVDAEKTAKINFESLDQTKFFTSQRLNF